ncbi:MAG: hypothetical protein ACLGGX_09115 [Bdellovibrionia bacterium]
MKNIYTWFLLALVVGGLALSFYLGNQHFDTVVIDVLEVEHPESFADQAFETLNSQPEGLASVLFLGVEPGQVEDLEVWRRFVGNINKLDPENPVYVMAEAQLPFVDLVSAQMLVNLKEERQKVATILQKVVAEKQRAVVIAPNIYTSQLLEKGPAKLYIQEHQLQFTSLSIVKFPITPGQAEVFDPPCNVDQADIRGTGALGCAIRKKSQSLWKYKVKPNHYLGRIEKVGESDFLILFNRY